MSAAVGNRSARSAGLRNVTDDRNLATNGFDPSVEGSGDFNGHINGLLIAAKAKRDTLEGGDSEPEVTGKACRSVNDANLNIDATSPAVVMKRVEGSTTSSGSLEEKNLHHLVHATKPDKGALTRLSERILRAIYFVTGRRSDGDTKRSKRNDVAPETSLNKDTTSLFGGDADSVAVMHAMDRVESAEVPLSTSPIKRHSPQRTAQTTQSADDSSQLPGKDRDPSVVLQNAVDTHASPPVPTLDATKLSSLRRVEGPNARETHNAHIAKLEVNIGKTARKQQKVVIMTGQSDMDDSDTDTSSGKSAHMTADETSESTEHDDDDDEDNIGMSTNPELTALAAKHADEKRELEEKMTNVSEEELSQKLKELVDRQKQETKDK